MLCYYGDYSALHNDFVHVQRVMQHKIWQSPVSRRSRKYVVAFLPKFTGKSSSPHQLSFKIASGPLGKIQKQGSMELHQQFHLLSHVDTTLPWYVLIPLFRMIHRQFRDNAFYVAHSAFCQTCGRRMKRTIESWRATKSFLKFFS